ncbi:hypothetical protein BO94DRAFT_622255 [Aspergillus sclerotioniger CBS 115572]|uniref:DUF6594 domain-containing protein n=1 Tax=Aspergillus sclerotioniger CBS 115572 TaxID=1450535 RepID=A0A317X835_9EURO|nr:hypothetical protein BO94DRAFT_622255 [Aspergillus sclerotioniger CBS 115572]PWY93058.1 hypothetical protein BO94DRAFT_622255 [Aspergillus sclerotioniger CBS 115572]
MASHDCKGYNKLAALMACDPGPAIYRRFAKLNSKTLLYLQAEISCLQNELSDIVHEVSVSEGKETYSFDLWDMKQDQYPFQWKKILEVRQLLSEYNTALIQQAEILRFSDPETGDLRVLQNWLVGEESGTMALSPPSQWNGDNEKNLLSLRNRHDGADPFTRWVYIRLIPLFHRLCGHKDTTKRFDIESDTYHYDDRKVRSRTYMISLIVAGFLPASSMIVLYFVRNTAARFATLFTYNIVFVLVMGFMVKARRVDIFATATVFAAVQVALITNTNFGA